MVFRQCFILIFILLIAISKSFAQDSLRVKSVDSIAIAPVIKKTSRFNALSPARAAFYSAILPGLGQAYNGKYWKIPFVYAALGTGVYFYTSNNALYNRVRTAYKLRLSAKPDEFDGTNGNPYLSQDALIAAQKTFKKDKDLSFLVTIGLYVLQIIEASANAHLLQFNVDNSLTLMPQFIKNDITNKSIVGAQLNLNF